MKMLMVRLMKRPSKKADQRLEQEGNDECQQDRQKQAGCRCFEQGRERGGRGVDEDPEAIAVVNTR